MSDELLSAGERICGQCDQPMDRHHDEGGDLWTCPEPLPKCGHRDVSFRDGCAREVGHDGPHGWLEPPRKELREAAQAFVDATEDPRIWAVLMDDGTIPVRLFVPDAVLDGMRDARNTLRRALAEPEVRS